MKTHSLLRLVAAVIVLSVLFAVSATGDEAQDQKKLGEIKSALASVESRLPEFNSLYAKCQAKGIRLDYPTVTKTMLGEFVPWAKEDLENKLIWRSEFAVKDFGASLDHSIAAMKAYLKDPSLAPRVKRYQTSKLDVRGLSLVGDRKDSTGKIDRGPLFFIGFGHFNQARENTPRWPGYGINMLQSAEMVTAAVLPAEDKIDLGPVNGVLKGLDEAAKHNVKVDVLLSAQSFPEWAFQKWPFLRNNVGTFIPYNFDCPEAKYVIEKYLRIVVPLLRDHPAVSSFCLTNEPEARNLAASPNTRPMWNDYLIRVHGDIKAVNERYATSYKSFDEVPIPGNEVYDAPQYYDWCVFNQQRFAAWHSWMADICRELAPNVPVHAKMSSMAIPHRFTISWGVDPELFAGFSDVYGNDCIIWPSSWFIGGKGWSIPYHIQNPNFDLQRSIAHKPIFNTENHPTDDRSNTYVAPEYFTNVLWQGAIHGQAATAIWEWQRAKPWIPGYEPTFIGNAVDRPGCVEATGMTCLDLNRFAEEVTALQNVRAPVAILFSMASICRSADYINGVLRFYTALNSCGVKIDFITEKQMTQGAATRYKLIVVPYAASVLPTTIAALKDLPLGTKIILSGDSLERDQYNRPYPSDALAAIRAKAVTIDGSSPDSGVIFPTIYAELAKAGGLSEYSVIDVATGKPAWGIEWLVANVGGRTVLNLDNPSDRPITTRVLFRGKKVRVNDLFSLGGKTRVALLKPMQIALGEVAK